MKWKIIIAIPYLLIIFWIGYWIYAIDKFGLGGILISTIFITYGVVAFVAYTMLLGIIFIVRKLVKRRR